MKTNLPKVYLDFIEKCRIKEYDKLFTHKHHITPKFMGGTNHIDNLINLSVEDHFLAHKILAENCDNEYKSGAASSLNILYRHWSRARNGGYEEIKNIVSAGLTGKRNGMYGKTHKPEIIEQYRQYMLSDKNPMSNPLSVEKVRLSKIGVKRPDMVGGNNKASRRCIDLETGKIYGCIKEMANDLNIPRTTMNRWVKNIKIKKYSYYE
jgi:hypothetical protein